MRHMVIEGTATVLGDYISGDVILPARHAFLEPDGMADHVLEELDPDPFMNHLNQYGLPWTITEL